MKIKAFNKTPEIIEERDLELKEVYFTRNQGDIQDLVSIQLDVLDTNLYLTMEFQGDKFVKDDKKWHHTVETTVWDTIEETGEVSWYHQMSAQRLDLDAIHHVIQGAAEKAIHEWCKFNIIQNQTSQEAKE